MTMPIKFDTLEYTRKLIEAGIVPAQAEAQTQALSDALAEATVSPSELVLLRTDLIARMEILREELHAKLKALEERINFKLEALEARLIARMDAKFTTVYWLLGISLTMQAVTATAVVGLLMK